LNVRRAYIGNHVLCNHCDQTFVVTDPARPQPRPAGSQPETISVMTLPPMGDRGDHPGTGAEYQQLRTKHDRLQGEHEQLQVVYNLLEASQSRLQAERDRLAEDLGRITAELETIRAGLGTMSPEEVRPLAAERESLRAEVIRLRAEIDALSAAEPTRDQMAAELEQRNGELATARAERDLLTRELEERDEHLNDARAELGRLADLEHNARDEIDRHRTSLADRDQLAEDLGRVTAELETIRTGLGTISPQEVRPLAEERESLRAAVECLRDEIDALRAEESTRAQMAAELEQRNGELATARAERDLLAREVEERDEHLNDARAELDRLAALEHDARDEIERVRTSLAERDHRLRNEGDQLRAVVETLHQALELAECARADASGTAQHAIMSRSENGNPIVAHPSADTDIQAASTDVEDLKRRLQDLERLNREMASVLWGMGIQHVSTGL